MQLTSLEVIPLRLPLREELRIARGSVANPAAGAPHVYVRVVGENGIEGWGEARPSHRWSYETEESVVTTIRHYLAPALEGLDLFDDLHLVAFEIIRRIGPPAIPLLVELLGDVSDSNRRSAADALIDLAPHTEGIQPALRRALGDEDSMVAGDAARALGALGKSASPSIAARRACGP